RVPPQHPMNSGARDTTQRVRVYSIRTPWEHSSVDSSPRPIAASHVLHRPLVPRHPHVRPSPLDHNTKMLASTIQLSTNHQQKTRHTPRTHHPQTTRGVNAIPRVRLFPHNPTGPPTPRTGNKPTQDAGG